MVGTDYVFKNTTSLSFSVITSTIKQKGTPTNLLLNRRNGILVNWSGTTKNRSPRKWMTEFQRSHYELNKREDKKGIHQVLIYITSVMSYSSILLSGLQISVSQIEIDSLLLLLLLLLLLIWLERLHECV